MATSDEPAISVRRNSQGELSSDHVDLGQGIRDPSNVASQPVELSDLSSAKPAITERPTEQIEQQSSSIPITTSTTDANVISSVQQPSVVKHTRISEDESAIGPATERPLANIRSNPSEGPQLVITLLLHSTDTRHPYIITEKYLKRRNIQVAANDPVNLTVYNLKDLIWRDWRDDWETRPASATSIRLIHMGRMLDDKAYLKDSRFTTGDSPHVVHMSIKPQEAIDDEDAKMAKGSTRDRDDSDRGSRCRCIVM